MIRRVGTALFWLWFAAGLVVTSYWLLFTTFKVYDDEGYILQTWGGQTLGRIKRTDNHPRMLQGYYGHRLSCGPMGFNGTRLESFRTLDPIAGYHWYGRGLGAGCALKLRRGRKA